MSEQRAALAAIAQAATVPLATASDGLGLLRQLAEGADTAETRVEAAIKLHELDRELGERTVLSLISPGQPRPLVPEWRLALGRRIGDSDRRLGIKVLHQVATASGVRPKLRLDATTAVTTLDWEQGSRLADIVGRDPLVSVYLKSTERDQ